MGKLDLTKFQFTSIVVYLLLIILTSSIVQGTSTGYQFSQLNSFFDESLFGISFDYNTGVPNDQALALKRNLLTQTDYVNVSDPNPEDDNVVTLIGHKSHDINSALLSIESVKRNQIVPLTGSFGWETVVPFTKFLHHFSLASGEDVILSQDFLGIALKANGTNFNPEHYQLGYANVPIEFLEFLLNEFATDGLGSFEKIDKETNDRTQSFAPLASVSIFISESEYYQRTDITYSNLTYLFQTQDISLEGLSGNELGEHFIIVQFDHISFSISIRKYTHIGNTGVETSTEVSIGNVTNLIINEELPTEQSWVSSEEYTVDANFKDLIPINEVFSWYKGSDIRKRLELFSSISFSFFTAQNLGIINGTQAVTDLSLLIDNNNVSIEELNQLDHPITDRISFYYDNELLLDYPIKGRDFVLEKNSDTSELILLPAKIQTIALNQHIGLANNNLFREETSLLRDIIAESIKHFIVRQEILELTTDQIFNLGGLYFFSAQYIQDFQILDWSGSEFKFYFLQSAIQSSMMFDEKSSKDNQITTNPIIPVLIALIIFINVKKKIQRK